MSMETRVRVRVVSCDAKVIGSLAGGCRVTIREADSGRILASGKQQGGSGNTEQIMKTPRRRGQAAFDDPAAAFFETTLKLTEPVRVQIEAEGPLAFPEALQRASLTTWLNPGRHIEGDGFVLTLHGFIVDILQPESVRIMHSGEKLPLEVGVRLL